MQKTFLCLKSLICKSDEVNELAERLFKDIPELNIVNNNAGHALLYAITATGVNVFQKAQEEYRPAPN